jgi:hypothetical protein
MDVGTIVKILRAEIAYSCFAGFYQSADTAKESERDQNLQ